ncbi:MAG TPA: His-Xaa-Ser system protein HxsD [Gaiellaceae bacterium]|nr:His-Xaa-Ser system protein HxsD [Gaiellaceae bacterium]
MSFLREEATVDVIQRAAYRFAHRFSIEVAGDAESLHCKLRPAPGVEFDEEQFVHEFRSEVLDQALRARIREETRGERDVILALAFSHSGLVDPP